VTPNEKILNLYLQLLRAESPAVVETVAAQLHFAIDAYVETVKRPIPLFEELPATKLA